MDETYSEYCRAVFVRVLNFRDWRKLQKIKVAGNHVNEIHDLQAAKLF